MLVFTAACNNHFLARTLWYPALLLLDSLKLTTAVVPVYTALMLVELFPKHLASKSGAVGSEGTNYCKSRSLIKAESAIAHCNRLMSHQRSGENVPARTQEDQLQNEINMQARTDIKQGEEERFRLLVKKMYLDLSC